MSIKCLCIGQSNMVGPGYDEWLTIRAYDHIYNWISGSFSLIVEPTILGHYCSPLTALGNRLYYYTGEDIYFINASENATGLHLPHPEGSRVWSARGDGSLYQDSLNMCTLSGMVPDVIFMFQGETDVIAGTLEADYLNDLNDLAADYRSYFELPNLLFIIAELGYIDGVLPIAVRSAQETFGTSINTNDRRIVGLENLSMKDEYHYTPSSLEAIGQLFAMKYYYGGQMATRTWSGAVDTDMNNPANYDGEGDLLTTDDLVFNAGAIAATASANLDVNSITTTSGYSGNMSFAGFTLTCQNGNAVFAHTGTLNLGNGLTVNGATAIFSIASGVGTLTTINCILTVNGTTNVTFTLNKAATFMAFVGGPNGICTTGGTETPIFNATIDTPPLTVGNNFILNNNGGIGMYFRRTSSGPMLQVGTGYTLTGTKSYFFMANASDITVSFPSFTYAGAIAVFFAEAATSQKGVTLNLAGNFTSASGELNIRTIATSGTFTFNTNNFNVTAGKNMSLGALSGGIAVYNMGSSAVNLGIYDGMRSGWNGAVSTINLQSSIWSCSGNFTWGTLSTVVSGTSCITFTNTSTITSNEKSFYDFVINATGKTITIADALSCHNITKTAGTITGNFSITFSGNAMFSVTTTLYRLIRTPGVTGTITVKDGATLTLLNLTDTDLNGVSGALTQWMSSLTGTQFNLVIPDVITLTYQNPKDCNSDKVITVNDGTSVDGGNNTNWTFPSIITLIIDNFKKIENISQYIDAFKDVVFKDDIGNDVNINNIILNTSGFINVYGKGYSKDDSKRVKMSAGKIHAIGGIHCFLSSGTDKGIGIHVKL